MAVTRKRPATELRDRPRKKVKWADQTASAAHPSSPASADDGSKPIEGTTLDSCKSLLSPELKAVWNLAASTTKPFDQIVACMPTTPKCFIGKHSFIVALDKQHFNLISAFERQHKLHPAEVSACLVVPDLSSAWFNPCLKGTQCLRQYPAGALAPIPTKVVYFAAEQKILSPLLSAGLSMTSMVFEGLVAGYPAHIAVDSQASHCFVSSTLVAKANLHVMPTAAGFEQLTLGTNDVAKVYGHCSLKLRIGSLVDSVPCYCIDMVPEFDFILGDNWLNKRSAVMNYSTKVLAVLKGDRRITVPVLRRAGHLAVDAECPSRTEGTNPPPLGDAPMLSALQFKRLLKKPWARERAFLVLLKAVDPVSSAESRLDEVDLKGPCLEQGVRALLLKYKHLWPAELPPGLPPVRDITAQHTIQLVPGAAPPAPRMYRLSPLERAEVEQQIKSLLDKGFIQPSVSPYGAPLLFVPKPDGSLRMCTDWRALNKQTLRDVYPLKRIDDMLDNLRGARVFSSIDLTQGYHQLRISEEDVPKTAFKTHVGLFEWKVLGFGLTNAPATFQRAMDCILAPYLGKFVCVYLDDICIYSRTPEEHLQHLEAVLQVFEKHQFYLNLSKCKFNKAEVKFLGHVVSSLIMQKSAFL